MNLRYYKTSYITRVKKRGYYSPHCFRNYCKSKCANAAVSDDDFPSTSSIRHRLEQFQKHFTRDVVTLYTDLTETVQLNTLSIAVKTDSTQRRV